jgi:hypothetical protein
MKISIDVLGIDRAHLAAFTILKELITGKLTATTDDLGKLRIVERYCVLFAALAAKVEFDSFPLHANVTITQSAEAIGAIVPSITLVTDPNERFFKQPHHCG